MSSMTRQERPGKGAREVRLADLDPSEDGIVPSQTAAQALRKTDRGRALDGEAAVAKPAGQRARGVDQLVNPVKGGIEHGTAGAFILGREEGRLAACPLQPGHGEVDPVEALPIGPQVLQVVEDLQGRAERIGWGVGRRILAVETQEEAPDGVGGAGAVAEKLGPIGIARLDGVLPEGVEQEACFREPGPVVGRNGVERRRFGQGGVARDEGLLHGVEPGELLGRRQEGGVGDVVRRAHEAVEGENRSAFRARQGEGGDGEVLVAVRLGAGGRAGGHGAPLAG
jgi:hypothetical protein